MCFMGHQRNTASGHAVGVGLDVETATVLATTLQALAAPSRLRILAVLREGPSTVGDLAVAVDMEQSAVSHQLRHLRDAGFAVAQRQGRNIYYRLHDTHVAELLDQALSHAEHVRLGLPEVSPREAALVSNDPD